MGYVVAAYGVVLATLVGYALWLRARRRDLERAGGSSSPEKSVGRGLPS